MNLNYHILYVENPMVSKSFYSHILGLSPRHSTPNFVLYDLPLGNKLGLWAITDIQPEVQSVVGGSELALTLADKNAVIQTYDEWKNKGITMIQKPTAMDFGHNFVALDPDGHRLRVFALA